MDSMYMSNLRASARVHREFIRGSGIKARDDDERALVNILRMQFMNTQAFINMLDDYFNYNDANLGRALDSRTYFDIIDGREPF